MVKVYVEFLCQGNSASAISEKEVCDRKESIKLPREAYGYRFFDREETGEDADITFGSKKNYSSVVYFGKEYTLEQLKKNMPGEYALISMLERNGYTRAVQIPSGQFFPLANSDTVKRIAKK